MDAPALILLGIIVLFVVGTILYDAGWLRPLFQGVVVIVFGLSGLAACFSMIASIIHFQILWAVGFFVLMALLWFVGFFLASLLTPS